MQKTTNYNLNQWEATDPIRREDFNADNAAIDAALKELVAAVPKIAFGTYVGTGTYGADNPNTLTFDFKPKVVIVSGGNSYYIIAQRPQTYFYVIGMTNGGASVATINAVWGENTFSWQSSREDFQLNRANVTYSYFALA